MADFALEALLVRRALNLLRYENHLSAVVADRLAALVAQLVADLPPATLPLRARREALRRAVATWRGTTDRAFADLGDFLLSDTRALFRAYADAAAADLGRTASVGIPGTFTVQGLPLARWVTHQRDAFLVQLEAAARRGVVAGDTTDAVAEAMTRQARRLAAQTGALARTLATQAASEGTLAGLRAAGVTQYRYVAILDERTTDICRGLNGKVFDLAEPESPVPPQHWNCRSHIEPVGAPAPATHDLGGRRILERAGLDLEAVQRAEERLLREGRAVRSTGLGLPPGWARDPRALERILRQQPGAVQTAILGRQGADRFRAGMSVAQVAQREGGQLTLDQLRERL